MTIEQATSEIRAFRVKKWKDEWQSRYKMEHGLAPYECAPAPPEPTDDDIDWPEPMVSVQQGKCLITMTLQGYNKLLVKQKKIFHKLGGLQK